MRCRVAGYVEETQKQRLPHLRPSPRIQRRRNRDEPRRRGAILEPTGRVDGDQGIPCWACSTALSRDGRTPAAALAAAAAGATRQVLANATSAVDHLISGRIDGLAGSSPAQALREAFRALGDVERILTRIALRSARPRDLSTLRDALALLPRVRTLLGGLDSPRLQTLIAELGEYDAQAQWLAAAIVPQPPCVARDGCVSATVSTRSRTTAAPVHPADQVLIDLERANARPGIASLKVATPAPGYYLEIIKGQSASPLALHASAAAAGAERYSTRIESFEISAVGAERLAGSREFAVLASSVHCLCISTAQRAPPRSSDSTPRLLRRPRAALDW